VFVVILHFFFVTDLDVAANFLANDGLGENAIANAGFEVVPVDALRSDGTFQRVHVGQFVLNADLVELLDDVAGDVDAHILATLGKERLVDQIA
jgi:hypothetical protein